MKKKNREALRTALRDFQKEHNAYLVQVRILMEMDLCGEPGPGECRKKYDPSAGRDWEILLEDLEETIERVLEDER